MFSTPKKPYIRGMRFLPLLVAAVLAVPATAPTPSLAQSAEQEFSRLGADRAHRLGVQQYRMHNYDLALRHFEKAVALAPDVEAYRHSLALTKQRIAIVKANQRRVQENVDRARKSMSGDDASPDASQIQEEISREMSAPADAAGISSRGRDASRSNWRGSSPFEDGPNLPGVQIRDANRDLGLGGSSERLGQPVDLPIAGSGGFDLPIGRLPSDLNRPLVFAPSAGTSSSASEAPTSGEGSMFPFLDPPTDPAPLRSRGHTPSAVAPSADGPNLDTPGTLP